FAERQLHEKPGLDRVVWVADKHIAGGIDADQAGLYVLRPVVELVPERGEAWPAALIEGHQRVKLAQARDVVKLFEIGPAAAVMPVYVLLAEGDVVLFVLTQHQRRGAREGRQVEPGEAKCPAGAELLQRGCFALAGRTV